MRIPPWPKLPLIIIVVIVIVVGYYVVTRMT